MTPDLPDIIRKALGPDAPRRVGVAISGGGDSTALLYGAVMAGFEVSAVTVDHRLRPESRAEAEGVAQLCQSLNIAHEILTWAGDKAEGNVYDAARRARFRLIGDWARRHGIADVLIGHTADDQAETFLMRIARSAGLEGLSGMRDGFLSEGVRWHRPMLTVGRAALRDWLSARSISWVEDPMNEDTDHARVRARKALPALRPAGVTVETICRSVAHLAEANRALDRVLTAWCQENATDAAGEVSVDFAAFTALDPELQRRLIVRALVWVAGRDYAPRAGKVAALLARLRAEQDRVARATIHGCRVSGSRGRLRFGREAHDITPARVPLLKGVAHWDGWIIRGPEAEGYEVAMLGPGTHDLPKDSVASRAAWLTTPAIWRGESLVAAPVIDGSGGWTALNLRGSFIRDGFRR